MCAWNTLRATGGRGRCCAAGTRKDVLDIACADGYGTKQLCAVDRKVVGVDRSVSLIQKARLGCKMADFHVIDVDENETAVKNLSPFDAVCCFETLEHVKYPGKAAGAFKRMHWAGAASSCFRCPTGNLSLWMQTGRFLSQYHEHAFSDMQLTGMLEHCGFAIEEKLHQHLSAQLHRNMSNTARDRDTTTEELESFFPQGQVEKLDLLSEVLAWPDDVQGKSYNMIYLCNKA